MMQPGEAGLVSIEQLHANSPRCSNPRAPHLLGIDPVGNRALYVRGSCGLWSCPECGLANVRQWVARAVRGVNYYMDNGYPDWWFMTVTAHRHWRSTSASLKNLRFGWRRLSERLRRKSPRAKYLRVFEHHADGRALHMHFVTTWAIPYEVRTEGGKTYYKSRWLQDNAAECGMGWNTDYRPIHNVGAVAGYVSKYLAKALERNVWPRGIRRIQASRGWPALPDPPERSEYVWEFEPSYERILERAARMWQWGNMAVTSVPHGRDLTTDDFSEYLT